MKLINRHLLTVVKIVCDRADEGVRLFMVDDFTTQYGLASVAFFQVDTLG